MLKNLDFEEKVNMNLIKNTNLVDIVDVRFH